jgi:3-hydroxyisobutyrate dehydrogenase
MTMAKDTVGVLGLGHMGSRIAAKLLDAGCEVTVWDRSLEARRMLEERGASTADTPRELAERVDVVLASLADDDAVRAVALGDSGALTGIRPGSVYVECSTVSPEMIQELGVAGRQRDASVVDACISGSTSAVEAGAVVVLAGGDAQAVDRVRPVLDPWSKTVLHMGANGTGVATKLAVNLILGVEMQAIAEAIVLGEAQGVERGTLIDALGKTAVIADAHRAKLENAKKGEYPAAFPARLMRKDFQLILEQARDRGIELPAAQAAARAAEEDAPRERGDEDFSAIVRVMEEAAGFTSARA